jgi:hypothetical protein
LRKGESRCLSFANRQGSALTLGQGVELEPAAFVPKPDV